MAPGKHFLYMYLDAESLLLTLEFVSVDEFVWSVFSPKGFDFGHFSSYVLQFAFALCNRNYLIIDIQSIRTFFTLVFLFWMVSFTLPLGSLNKCRRKLSLSLIR